MCCRNRSCHNDIFKFFWFIQTCCNKKYKNNFYELRRLYIYACNFESQLCPAGNLCEQCNCKKSCSSYCRINICPLIKELHFSDQNRNNKSKGNSQSNKYKLSYRRAVRRRIICGQSRDHDHPDSDQHTHIIYNKPWHIRINQIIQKNDRKKNHRQYCI